MEEALLETCLEGVPLFARGKVRDVYDLDDRLLIVATDRISAYDVVMPNGIPGKGKILTEMSLFWFDRLAGLVRDHLISGNVDEYPEEVQPYKDQLEGRSMLVVKADRIDVECVARGYLAGSGWREYQDNGMVCGIPLPAGLQESSRLSEPVFTPATKAETGHDENISFDQMCEVVDPELAGRLRDLTLQVYAAARDYAEGRGIIIADTKFEFGLHNGGIVLIDEILSPDSSRFWDQAVYAPGRSQDSFDKQFVRDYLDTLDWGQDPSGAGVAGRDCAQDPGEVPGSAGPVAGVGAWGGLLRNLRERCVKKPFTILLQGMRILWDFSFLICCQTISELIWARPILWSTSRARVLWWMNPR